MADFNTAGQTALAQQVVNIAWMAWLDIVGDVIRVTTGPYPLTFGGTGDADLDGFTFGKTDGLISIGEVTHKQGGAESVTAYLSGIQGIDTATLNQIGTKANFQGRTARLWMVILDPVTNAVVSISAYYTGFMMTPRIAGSTTSQTVALEIESFLASLSDASGRSYLNQQDYDSGDLSAAASIASANGSSLLTGGGAGGGSGGAGGGGSAGGGGIGAGGAFGSYGYYGKVNSY